MYSRLFCRHFPRRRHWDSRELTVALPESGAAKTGGPKMDSTYFKKGYFLSIQAFLIPAWSVSLKITGNISRANDSILMIGREEESGYSGLDGFSPPSRGWKRNENP